MRGEIDRARRDLSGIIIGFVGTNSRMNRQSLYSKFRDLGAFLASDLGFPPRRRALWRKMRSAIDRARRNLSCSIIGFVSTGIEANPDLRYLTLKNPSDYK